MQYWDDVLYPAFRSTIKGEIYGIISRDDMDEICFNLTQRAISAFKFPKVSLEYTTFYAIRQEDDVLIEADDNDDNAIPHAYFKNTVTYAELEVVIAWMRVYWCEHQISNADNFEEIYTDANIKTYSRANMVSQNIKMLEQFREYAKDLENRYSRVNGSRRPSLGDVND